MPGTLVVSSSGEDPWSRPTKLRRRKADGVELIRRMTREKSEGAHLLLTCRMRSFTNAYREVLCPLFLHRYVKTNYLEAMDDQASMGKHATINSYYFMVRVSSAIS
jgi:hypothetical protein